MTTWTLRVILCGLLFPLFSLTVLAQGLSFEIVRGGNGDEGGEKGLYMPGMFRQEDKNGHVSILRLDREVMFAFNPEKKTYTETTFKELEAKVKQGRLKANEAMKQRMAGMPPEQRKKLEERMAGITGQHADQKEEVAETGKRRTIDGYSCTGYTVKLDGKEFETVWATRDIPNFASVRKDFQRISSFFTSLTGSRTGFASLEKINGFPLERGGAAGIREKITKIQKGSFPSSMFDIPPGYTKEKSEFE